MSKATYTRAWISGCVWQYMCRVQEEWLELEAESLHLELEVGSGERGGNGVSIFHLKAHPQ